MELSPLIRYRPVVKKLCRSALYSLVSNSGYLCGQTNACFYSRMTQEELYLCFPDKTVRLLKTSDKTPAARVLSLSQTQATGPNGLSTKLSTCFMEKDAKFFLIAQSNCENVITEELNSYINSCLELHSIYRSSKISPSYSFGLTTAQFFGNEPLVGGHLRRILCATINQSEDFSKIIQTIPECKNVNIFQLETSDTDDILTLTHRYPNEHRLIPTFWKLRESPQEHGDIMNPVFNRTILSPVYHDIDRALSVLNQCNDMPEVKELIEIYLNETDNKVEETPLKHPFIVIEGLDATGKTTLTKSLERRLNAVRYCTPPPVLQHLRKYFTRLPEIIARAYYQLGNYIVAKQIHKQCQSTPVIMDRYWHSTAAYGIANETSCTDMPPVGHFTYSWPSTLLKPTLVLFLSVSESTRKQRMSGRHGEMTFEEIALDGDLCFRKRLYEAYKRMEKPDCVEIDANGSKNSVEDAAILFLKQHNVQLTN